MENINSQETNPPVTLISITSKETASFSHDLLFSNKEIESIDTRISSDSFFNNMLNEKIYLDIDQTCIDFLFLDTFFLLNQKKIFSESQAKADLVKYLEEKGSNLENEDRKLLMSAIQSSEFESNILNWFTKESFLYNFISKAYKAFNYCTLFKIRYFVILLYENLNKIMNEPVNKVYHVSEITKEELNLLQSNINKPLLLKGFISTTSKLHLAEKCLNNRKTQGEKVLLLLSINVDDNKQNILSSLNGYSECEYLIKGYCLIKVDQLSMMDSRLNAECSFLDYEACQSKFHPSSAEYLRKCKKMSEKIYPNDNFFLFDFLNEKACYNECFSVLSEITDNTDECLAWKDHKLGIAYHNTKDFDHAIEHYESSLKKRLVILGENHQNTATLYYNIGLAAHNINDYNKAIFSYQKCLKIWISTLGDTHPDIVDAYNMLALAYYNKGDYDSSIRSFESCLKITVQTLGDYHQDTAMICKDIGDSYYQKNDYENTFKYYDMSLEILQAIAGEKCPETEAIRNQLKVLENKRTTS